MASASGCVTGKLKILIRLEAGYCPPLHIFRSDGGLVRPFNRSAGQVGLRNVTWRAVARL